MLSTKLISYKEIINEIKHFQVPDEKSILPIDVRDPNLEVLRKIMSYGIVLMSDSLFVVFTVPKLNREKLFLTKAYSIPKIFNDTAKCIVMPDEFITFDEHHEKIASLSSTDLRDSCKIIKNEYFCENLNSFNKAKESCIHSIFYRNFERLQMNYETKNRKLTESLIEKTSSQNKYLITSPKETFGKLALKTGPQKIRFEGTQMLEVQEDARLFFDEKKIDFYTGSDKIQTEFSLISDFPNVELELEIEPANFTKVEKVKLLEENNIFK